MKTYPQRPFCSLSTQIDFPVLRLVVDNARVAEIIAVHEALDGKISDNALSDVLASTADSWHIEGQHGANDRARIRTAPVLPVEIANAERQLTAILASRELDSTARPFHNVRQVRDSLTELLRSRA